MTIDTRGAAALLALLLLSLPAPTSADDGFAFVTVSTGHLPEPLSGHGFDSVSAANDGSDLIWACSRSGSLVGYSVAHEGSSSGITAVYLSGPATVPGCSALTFLHGPSCVVGTHICNNTSPLVPNITGLVAATDAGLVAYGIKPSSSGGGLELSRSSKVSPPTAGAVTALRPFRHFKSPTPGQLDPTALIVGASSAGELFAAHVSANGSLDVASGSFQVAKLANVSAGGATPAVGGFAAWDYMGISMYLGVTLRSGPIVLNSVQISGHDNLEPQDPSSWGVRGLPGGQGGVHAPVGFPRETGCGDTVEHNDLIYIACAGANAVLAVSLESDTNPVFNIPFPGRHARGLLLVGDALFVAGGNDVVVYDLSKVNPDTPSKTPPIQVGRCSAACAKILGSSASRANAHGMAYRYDAGRRTHNLVLTAAYANRVGVIALTSPAITGILTRYACDPEARRCVPNQQGEFDDRYSCRLSAGDSPGSECQP
jgi:hypothetical protein